MRYPNQPPKRPKPNIGIPSQYPMKGSEPAKVHVRPTIRVDFTNLKKVLKDLQKTKPSTLMNVSGWWKVIAEGEVIAYFPEKQDAQDYWDNLGDLDWTIEEIK